MKYTTDPVEAKNNFAIGKMVVWNKNTQSLEDARGVLEIMDNAPQICKYSYIFFINESAFFNHKKHQSTDDVEKKVLSHSY